jgi:enamine deaminase RidA (YjgF/YER057c/UK114 family)
MSQSDSTFEAGRAGGGARRRVSSGSPYESVIGISRALRAGRLLAVAGTAPLDPEGRTVAPGDCEAQARRCFEIIARALEDLGAKLSDVVRTRVMLTRIEDWERVARAHGEFFKDARPACTFVQVSRFIDPEWLVEVEADAWVED